MTNVLAAGFVINSDWLKYGFIGLAAVLALAAATIYQAGQRKSLTMLITYLAFALILAAMGLISPMIHDVNQEQKDKEETARQHEESTRQLMALKDKLTFAKQTISGLLRVKTGVLAQLDGEPNQDGRIHQATDTLRTVDEEIGKAIDDTEWNKLQIANRP